MTIVRIPLTQPLESRTASASKDSVSSNVIFSKRDGGQKKEIINRPGTNALTIIPALPTAKAQGMFASLGDKLWVASDNTLYQVKSDFTSGSFGNIGANFPPVSFNQSALTQPIGSKNFTSDDTFVVPAGVTSMTITAIGASGGTGGGSYPLGFDPGGGSGSGEKVVSTVTVIPGDTLTITIGKAGTGGGLGARPAGVGGIGLHNGFSGTPGVGGLTAGTGGGGGGSSGVSGTGFTTVEANGGAGGGGGGHGSGADSSGGDGSNHVAIGGVPWSGQGHNANDASLDPTIGHGILPTPYNQDGVIGTDGAVFLEYTGAAVSNPPNYLFLHNLTDGYVVAPGGVTVLKISGGIYSVSVTVAGTAFVNGDTVTFSAPGGGGRTATGTVLASGGALTGVTVTDPGSGYTSPPTMTFPHGTGQTATVILGGFPTGQVCYGTVYLDGTMYVLSKTGRIYGSDIDRPDLWGPLNFITAQAEPDPGVALVKHLNYLVAFGEWSTEFFYDAGNPSPGSPLLPYQSAKIEIGCACATSVTQLEQSVIWIGSSKEHGRSVYLLDGTAPSCISTEFVDRYLNKDPLLEVRSFVMKISGHTLYVLNLYSSKITLLYDMNEKQWYVWSSPDINRVEGVYQFSYYTNFLDSPTALTYDTGTLATVSEITYTDMLDTITINIVTDNLDVGNTNRKFHRSIELVGDKTKATWAVSHSDDDYVNWSNPRTIVANKPRAVLQQLGQARRRAYKFTTSDAVQIRILAAELVYDTGKLEVQG